MTQTPLPSPGPMPLPPALAYHSVAPAPLDEDHLKLLMIFHYVWGGLLLLFSCFPIIYIVLGAMLIANPQALNGVGPAAPPGPPPPAWMGWMFVGIGTAGVVLGGTVGGLNLYSARLMQRRRGRTLSLVLAGINCLSVPLGTVLGVFTFIVLLRASVARLYATAAAAEAR